jgi:hypothetical protein
MHVATHPSDHVLQLPYASLLKLQSAVDQTGDEARDDVHREFILYLLP